MYSRIVKLLFFGMLAAAPLIAMEDRSENLAAQIERIEQETKDINISGNCNLTPLVYCMMIPEYHSYIEFFLDQVNVKNPDGLTPLMLAVPLGKEIVSLLLDHGAQVSIPNNQGLTALDWAKMSQNSEIVALLERALANEHYSLVSSDREKPERELPNSKQLSNSTQKKIDKIKRETRELNQEAGYIITPLMCAILRPEFHKDIPLILDDQIDKQTKTGTTALMLAVEREYIEIVKQLLDHGAQVLLANKRGQTALDIAADYQYLEILALLHEQESKELTQQKEQAVSIGVNQPKQKEESDIEFDSDSEFILGEDIDFFISEQTTDSEKEMDCSIDADDFDLNVESFEQLDDAALHYGQTANTVDEPYKCTALGCTKSYTKLGHLKRHVDRVHNNIKPYRCNYIDCSYATDSQWHLERHAKTHTRKNHNKNTTIAAIALEQSGNVKAEEPIEKVGLKRKRSMPSKFNDYELNKKRQAHEFVCNVGDCGKRFFKKSKLTRHQKGHTEGKLYPPMREDHDNGLNERF